MTDIFISYDSADRDPARLLADTLTKRGYSVWWDRTIPPGRVFDEVIQEAIQGARCMIVLWSAESVRSNWVKTEAAEGAARGILVPALIAAVAPPIAFKRIQSANLAQWDGDEAHAEYRNLLGSVERMIASTPRGAGTAASVVDVRMPPGIVASSRIGAYKGFVLGAGVTLLAVCAIWLYTHAGKEPAAATVETRAEAGTATAPAVATDQQASTPAAKAPSAASPRGRVNLLSAENGGQLLAASAQGWVKLIDGKEDTRSSVNTGFGVFGFRDGRPALIDSFTLLIPGENAYNVREFELSGGNAGPTGPFESIGRFSTQNMRMMQNPYQEFKFAPVKVTYFKLQTLRAHNDGKLMDAHEIQLFGRLQ